MISKKSYTKVFLNQLGKSTDVSNVKSHMYKWWFSATQKSVGGLRLSDDGNALLQNELSIQSFYIPFTEPIGDHPQVLIFLDNYLDCPYHLDHKGLTVYSEKRHVELYMFSDDIRRFGMIKAMNNRVDDLENPPFDKYV